MSETWYEVSKHSGEITSLEVTKHTEHCVWMVSKYWDRPRRTKRDSAWSTLHPTFEEAKKQAHAIIDSIVANANHNIKMAHKRLDEIADMTIEIERARKEGKKV